jgi:acetylornithine deacetylase/succinyl-diaminopimelate desuccinylase-like protein
MLYAPIDTLTAGTEAEDLPWIGPELRADMRPQAVVDGPYVTGLGASNPKGHAACVLAAAEAVARTVAAGGLPLRGDLVAAFGAGGMPTNARPVPGRTRTGTGHGVGASFLLEQGVWTDAAVIAKPGWAASAAEVGLVWFDVWVSGTHTYVGSRHRLPYVNAIAQAATVVAELEAWFERYAAAHADARVAPQGVVSSIEGGWPRLAAATPGRVRLRCDVRLAPGRSPASLVREFTAAVAAIIDRHPGLAATVEPVLTIPGSATPEDAWVVRSTVAAWEAAEGRPHQAPAGMSGATDANILRNRGIPTVRIGMPKVGAGEHPAPFEVDFARGMNTVDVRDMERLTRLLVRVAVDTCTRTFEETGDQA